MSKKQLLSSIPTWIFDPQPPSGRPEGGFESIKNTGKLSVLEIIIRESIQNSKDRMLNNTLNMTYKLFELDGNFKEEYLRNLNFKELEPHLKASTDFNLTSGESKHIKKGLNVLKIKKSKLRILVIEDNNCEGLTGKEDDDTSNFVLLCKGNMATTPKGFKGGSWGVGKKSFLETSGIRTLLFSSIPKDTKKIRIFGRTITPSHTTSDGNKFSTAGFFGIPNKEGNANESFNDANLAKKLLIGREEGNTGTSIAIICFNDSTTNFDEFTAKVEDFIQKYYWPVLENLLPEQKKLNVKIERFENNSKSSKTINEVTIVNIKLFKSIYRHQ